MNVKRLAVVVGLAVSALAVAPPAGAATPSIALGDIAGFTATPGGQVTQVSLTVSVPTAVTSADCNMPGTFEYALFGFSFSADTFARVDSTCGNTGHIAYFIDIEVAGTFKIGLPQPGQLVTLTASVNGSTMTITQSHGTAFKSVSGSPGAFSSVGIGGTNVAGFDIPVLTKTAHFTNVKVNGTGLFSVPKSRTALANGSHVLMTPSTLTSANAFNVRYVSQS
jgi:hypothetical protein